MIKEIDDKWYQGEYLNFKDEGRVSEGSITKKYALTSRMTATLLGYVKWYNHWRQYCFFPINSVFDKKCMREVADFCELVTNKHRSRWV